MPRFCCRFGKEPKTIVTISVVRELVFNVYGVNVRESDTVCAIFDWQCGVGRNPMAVTGRLFGRRTIRISGRRRVSERDTDRRPFIVVSFRNFHHRFRFPQHVSRWADCEKLRVKTCCRPTPNVDAIDVQYYCAVSMQSIMCSRYGRVVQCTVRNQNNFEIYREIRKILRRILVKLCDI